VNKRGQSFYMLIVLLIVGLVWITGLSGWISEVGQAAISAGNLTGLDAFFYANLNLVIGVAWLLSLAVVVKLF